MFIVLLPYCWFLFVWIGDNYEKFKWPMMQTVKKRGGYTYENVVVAFHVFFVLALMIVIKSI